MKNTPETKPKIGILGGMGPQASCELLRLLVSRATAKFGVRDCDQFPEIILDSVPVPDFISDTGRIPTARQIIVSRARQLRQLGCNPIVLACNSAHVMAEDIRQAAGPRFRSLIGMMAAEAGKRKLRRVCIFATPTTIRNDLYGKIFRPLGIEVINPDNRTIAIHERIIRKVISGENTGTDRKFILSLARKLLRSGRCDGLILGCTELPVAVSNVRNPRILSSLEVLADNLLENFYEK